MVALIVVYIIWEEIQYTFQIYVHLIFYFLSIGLLDAKKSFVPCTAHFSANKKNLHVWKIVEKES